MMEKKYELVAWTRNITNKEKARLYVVRSVENDLLEPLITKVSECRREQEKAKGHISPRLAREFAKVYEQSARLDLFLGNIDYAIKFFLMAADCCLKSSRDTDRERYSYLCAEAVSLARKYRFEHILEEAGQKNLLKTRAQSV